MFCPLLLAVLAQAQAPAAVPAAAAAVAPRALYAALPLRNLTADGAAPAEVIGRVRQVLEARGAGFVPAETVEALLQARRVRYTDSVSSEDARALQQASGAGHVITGTLLEFARGKQPHLALSLRVIDAATGRREQSIVVSLRGEDFKGWLGLGAIEDADELVARAVDQIAALFAADGSPALPGPRPERRVDPEDRPSAARAKARFEPADAQRLAVLPFVNRSTRPEASTQFVEVLGNEWFRAERVEVVEASELRAAMIREKIRYLSDLDPRALAAVGGALGVRYFVFGSLDRYGEEEQVADKHYPVVEATLRLVDAESGLVVASNTLRVRGDAHRQPLGFGIVRDPLVVAADVARRLITKLGG